MFKKGDSVLCVKAPDYFDIKEGEIYTVKNVDADGWLEIAEVRQVYVPERFKELKFNGVELLQEIKKGNFTNCDIKVYKENKYKFTIQSGEKAILDNPNHHIGMLTSDKYAYKPIMKKEMTISEIEKELGYPIKIIKED